jgi:hypothetical protein
VLEDGWRDDTDDVHDVMNYERTNGRMLRA